MSIEKGGRCVLPNLQLAVLSSSSNNELNCPFLEITVSGLFVFILESLFPAGRCSLGIYVFKVSGSGCWLFGGFVSLNRPHGHQA